MTHFNITPGGKDGRPLVDAEAQDVLEILQKHSDHRGGLIAILEAIQLRFGYLPEEALRTVSAKTGRSLVDVYGVATFYRSFSLTPRGKHLICVCLGTACHVRGAPRIAEAFQQRLGIKPGETTPDGEFTLETVNCLGACALGPVVVIDGRYFSKVRKSRIRQLLEEAAAGFDTAPIGADSRIFPIGVSCPRCNHSLMDARVALDGYPSIRVSISRAHRHGWLRFSSLYGSCRTFSEEEIPAGTVVDCYCPHCHAKLAAGPGCPACDAPLVPMIVQGGGVAQFCSRHGCQSRMLELT